MAGIAAGRATEPAAVSATTDAPFPHRLRAERRHGLREPGVRRRYQQPTASALADVVCLPLDQVWGAEPILPLLFEEAFEQRCGRVALVERLLEVVMIQVLRQLMESDEVNGGLLSGLAHPRLRNALVAMHEAPAQD